jgi:hypothetical protein
MLSSLAARVDLAAGQLAARVVSTRAAALARQTRGLLGADRAAATPKLSQKLLTKLRHVPNPTPAKLLAEFRQLD